MRGGQATSRRASLPINDLGSDGAASVATENTNMSGKYWTSMLLLRHTLHFRSTLVFSMPRLSLFGVLWAVIELTVFVVSLARMDLSFESLDMAEQMIRARSDTGEPNSNMVASMGDSDLPNVVLDDESSSVITIMGGTLGHHPSNFCGPQPGTIFFRYIFIQTLLSIARAIPGESTTFSSATSRPSSPIRMMQTTTPDGGSLSQGRLLELLICNRSLPLYDHRSIMSSTSQGCKEPLAYPNSSGMLSTICQNAFAYYGQPLVPGVRSVCFFPISHQEEDSSQALGYILCLRVGKRDLEREDLQWLSTRLTTVWERIKISALAWILLSILMRVVYWCEAVRVGRACFLHFQTECNVAAHHQRRVNLPSSPSPRSALLLPDASPSVRDKEEEETAEKCVPGVEDERLKQPDNNNASFVVWPPSFWSWSRKDMEDVLTASSLGIVCANNNSAYLALAILRQILGSAYGEILISVVTTAKAAWQAFSIVVYHEAIVHFVFYGIRSLLRRLRHVSDDQLAIRDVGIIGYISFIIGATSTQSNQLFNWDLLYIFQSSTSAKWSLWWLIFPACGPDGPCMFFRGDIVLYTVTAVYTSILVILVQSLYAYYLRKKHSRARQKKETGQGSAICLGLDLSSKGSKNAKATSDKSPSAIQGNGRQWKPSFGLGVVRCPRCRASFTMVLEGIGPIGNTNERAVVCPGMGNKKTKVHVGGPSSQYTPVEVIPSSGPINKDEKRP